MGQHFIACDREQTFLMPPDVRDWLAEGHLAWFVIDAVAEMNLDVFYVAYRQDGSSRPAYDPAMMVALLLYAYARGTRSSRQIERGCEEDVALRVLAAQQRPDHATIARFVDRRQDAIAGLFGEVLSLCAKNGLASVGVIAVDGTKVPGNASRNATVDYEQLAREILEEAKRSTRPRTSSSARRAATSCPSSCALARAAGRGCAKPSASWRSSAPGRRGPFGGTAASA
jgi:transposase